LTEDFYNGIFLFNKIPHIDVGFSGTKKDCFVENLARASERDRMILMRARINVTNTS
jgi:hypothetical protein